MSYKKSNYNDKSGGGGGGYKKSWNNEGGDNNGGGYKKPWNNESDGYKKNWNNGDSNGGGYKKTWNNESGGDGYKKNWNNDRNNSGGNDGYKKTWDNNRDQSNNSESGSSFYVDKVGNRNNNRFNNNDRNNNQSYDRNNNNNDRNNNNNDRKPNKKEEYKVENANETPVSTIQLDLDTRSYFTRIESLINKQEEAIDQEEIDIIVENAYKEIEGKESLVACDKKTSLVLESMFNKCKEPMVIVKFFESFSKEFGKLIHDANGSRVLEGILRCTPKIINKSQQQPETITKYTEILFALIDVLTGDITKTVTDRYASYVFSSIILILSGKVKEKKIPTGGFAAEQHQQFKRSQHKSYKEKLAEQAAAAEENKPESLEYPVSKEFTDKLRSLLELIKEPIKSNMVKYSTQKEPIESIKSIFQVLSNAPVEVYRSWLEAFIKMSNVEFSKKQLIKAMKNQFGSVFCEVLVRTSPEEIFLEIVSLVKHDLLDLSEDMYANHVIQMMIDQCHNSGNYLILVQEFKEHFSKLFKFGRGLVVQKLIEQSLKYSTYEKEIVKLLNEAVLPNYKTDQKDIARHLLGLEGNVSSTQMYSACGSAILQLLFKFSNDFNKTAIESFISLDIEYLVSLATNNIGSKVLDVFLDSPNVPLVKKNQLIVKFNGNFVTIGEDRYGSYSIEKMYKIADFKQKDVIAIELMNEEQRLFSRPCGRYVLMICQINKYKKKKENWVNDMNQKDKKRKLFNDIINDSGDNNGKKVNNKKEVQKEEDDYVEEEEQEEEQPKKKSKKSTEKETDEIDDIFNSKSSSNKNKKKK